MTSYIVPKEDKMFWGSEFMNAQGVVTRDIAKYRLELHINQHGLKTLGGFNTDDELRQILKTDKTHLTMAEALSLLGMNATCSFILHNYDHSWKEYARTWEGVKWTATCQDCGHVWRD